jgi:hypothetical protein
LSPRSRAAASRAGANAAATVGPFAGGAATRRTKRQPSPLVLRVIIERRELRVRDDARDDDELGDVAVEEGCREVGAGAYEELAADEGADGSRVGDGGGSAVDGELRGAGREAPREYVAAVVDYARVGELLRVDGLVLSVEIERRAAWRALQHARCLAIGVE